MIEGKNFKIYEPDDIVQAANRLEVMALKIKEMADDKNPLLEPFDHTYAIVNDLFTAIAAAGIGCAICKQQGGLVLLKEGASPEDHKEAVAALEELRKKSRAAAAATTGGIPQ